MKHISKLMLPVAALSVALTLVLANVVFAAPTAPTAPAPTTCGDCQAEQDALDAAYLDLEAMVADIAAVSDQIEPLLTAMDPLVAADQVALITSGQQCDNSNNSFSYYSSFMFDAEMYCFADATEYDDFFQSVLVADAANAADWTTIEADLYPLLTDDGADTDPDDVEDLLAAIDALALDLEDCELLMCPVPVTCLDCEAFAADLEVAMDDYDAAMTDADAQYTTAADLEADLDAASSDFVDFALLEDEVTLMVEGTNGMTGADCDNLALDPNEAWGTVHNFGSLQWCYVDQPSMRMDDFVADLGDFWANNSADYLPADATLNADLDALMNSYVSALTDYEATLADLANLAQDVDQLSNSLDGCLNDLQSSTDPGMCQDYTELTMADLVTAGETAIADGTLKSPATPGPQPSGAFDDTAGHWAEAYIQELKDAGVVSGDGGTNNFRPDGQLNRAEAAKIVPLAKADTIGLCDAGLFPDVTALDWFCEYVSTSTNLGYFQGYPHDGTFKPANLILRSEAAAVIMRSTGLTVPTYTTYTFPDIAGDEWYADYAEKAYKCGIFSGRQVGAEQHFAGGEQITRAEFAKIVDLAVYNTITEADCAL